MDCGSVFQLCEVCRATHAPPDREGRFLCFACFVEDVALQAKEARRKSIEAAGKSFVSRHSELLGKLAKGEEK